MQIENRNQQSNLLMQPVLREVFKKGNADESKTDEIMDKFYDDCEKANKVKLEKHSKLGLIKQEYVTWAE